MLYDNIDRYIKTSKRKYEKLALGHLYAEAFEKDKIFIKE